MSFRRDTSQTLSRPAAAVHALVKASGVPTVGTQLIVTSVPDDERAIHAALSIQRQLPAMILVSRFRTLVERSDLHPTAVWESERPGFCESGIGRLRM